MNKRIKTIVVTGGALGALALGGSALAAASTTSPTPAPEKVSATDTGPAVQQGDQTTPDGKVTAETLAKHAQADPAGTNDTTSPDTGSAVAENAPDSASSETGPSDGPGGFADTNPTADTQQQGEH